MIEEPFTAHGTPPRCLTFPSLERLGLPHAVTTRHCPGVTPFRERTAPGDPPPPFGREARSVLADLGLDLDRLAYARQVHGVDHARVTAEGPAGVLDILITTERRLPLAISTADCIALTLCDPGAGALALAHLGWRGTVRGGARAAVAALRTAGGRPAHLRASMGPSIGPCCYEVDEPVMAQFRAAHPRDWERWARPGRPGHFMLDLWTANEDLLAEAGVPRAAVENPRLCTGCNLDVFYSYRKGQHGRLVTLAALA